MPLPLSIARFNRRVTNRVLTPLVRHLPGFGIVIHIGRRSGREYRTPLLGFRDGDRITFALTYGPETDWVRNTLVADGCRFVSRGREMQLTGPRLVHDPTRQMVPAFVRLPLRLLTVSDFLVTTVVPSQGLRNST